MLTCLELLQHALKVFAPFLLPSAELAFPVELIHEPADVRLQIAAPALLVLSSCSFLLRDDLPLFTLDPDALHVVPELSFPRQGLVRGRRRLKAEGRQLGRQRGGLLRL